MDVDCGDCTDFVAYAQRHFSDLLARHEFRSVQCKSQRDGRECMWMVESSRCRMLFTLGDNQEDISMGRVDTPFPGDNAFRLNGEVGWYNVLWLIEFKAGKQLLNRRLINKFMEDKRAYFQWLSPLLEKWFEDLIAMFAGHEPPTWHDDFVGMREARKPF